MPRSRLRPLALVCALATAAPAAAQPRPAAPAQSTPPAPGAASPRLAPARTAIEAVRYDQAQELLAEALRTGQLTAAEVREVYELAAGAAVVLGQAEVAEQFYRRLLSIAPDAALDPGLAPKFKQPFTAAAAYVDAHGSLRARARWLPTGELELLLESDPLKMVDAVAYDEQGAAAIRLDADRRARLPASAARRVALLDERRNQLVLIDAPAAAPKVEPATKVEVTPAPVTGPTEPRLGLARTWWAWAIPAGAALAIGVGFGLGARNAHDELTAGLDEDSLFYGDAKDLRDRADTYSTIANVSFATAGALAVTAAVMWKLTPSGKRGATALAPLAPGHGVVGVALSGAL